MSKFAELFARWARRSGRQPHPVQGDYWSLVHQVAAGEDLDPDDLRRALARFGRTAEQLARDAGRVAGTTRWTHRPVAPGPSPPG